MEWIKDKAEIEQIIGQYPVKRSAILPLLHKAQAERGYLTTEDYAAVAELVDETPAYVESVASFYAMYHKRPVGKYVITVCNNLSCALGGASRLIQHLEQQLGVRHGQTTPDGLITLEVTSECLAACNNAPCMQVNLQHYHRVTPAKAEELLASLRKGELPAWPEPTSLGEQAETVPDPMPTQTEVQAS